MVKKKNKPLTTREDPRPEPTKGNIYEVFNFNNNANFVFHIYILFIPWTSSMGQTLFKLFRYRSEQITGKFLVSYILYSILIKLMIKNKQTKNKHNVQHVRFL